MDIVEIPTVVLLCLFQGLVVGLLRPRPFLKQINQSSSSGKFHERHSVQFLWNSFYRKRLPQQNGDMRKRDLHAFKLHLEQGRLLSPLPRPPPPHAIRGWRALCFLPPPPPPTHSPWLKYVIFSVLGQKQGQPLIRGSKVLQLNSDSFCDYVRI